MPQQNRRMIALGLMALASATSLGARAAEPGFVLISPEDYAQEQRLAAKQLPPAEDAPMAKGLPMPPFIQVVTPRTDLGAVNAPVRIELAFETTSDARIDPASFRVLYGFLKLDLTDKVRKNAQITEKGLVAKDAAIPAGSHKLILRIADDKGRVSEQELRFSVGP